MRGGATLLQMHGYKFDKMQGPVVMVVVRENRTERFKVVKARNGTEREGGNVPITRPLAESPG